jgi:hypothetical protein
VSRLAKILIVVLALGALPLRGYAAIAIGMCERHHGQLAASQSAQHDARMHGAHGQPAPGEDATRSLASACDLCAGCCVASPVACAAARTAAAPAAATARIPFLDQPVAGVVTGPLDPPPLARSR